MDTIWIIIGLLALVSTVYVSAYRLGYRASQARAEALVREMRAPVEDMLARLHRELDPPEAAQREPRGP